MMNNTIRIPELSSGNSTGKRREIKAYFNFVYRETARKFQYTVAQMSVWERRS